MDKPLNLYEVTRSSSLHYCKGDFGPIDEKSFEENGELVFLGFGKSGKNIPSKRGILHGLEKIKKKKVRYWTEHKRGKYGDIASAGGTKIFSKKFLELLEKNKICKLKPFKINIINADSPEYYYIETKTRLKQYSSKRKDSYIDVSGIDPSWEGMEEYRIYFDLNDWKGESFFMVGEGSGTYVCTKEVKELIERSKLKNINFKELENKR